MGTGAGWPGVGCCTRFEGAAQEIRLVHDERPATPEAPFCLRERAQCSAAYLTCRYYSSLEHTLVRRPRSASRDTPRETACLGSRGPRASVEISQSVSQSLPHSYQRSKWSLHTLIFCTSVRWNLSILLWFLFWQGPGLALQVDVPRASSVSSLRTSGRSPTSGWSSLRTPG